MLSLSQSLDAQLRAAMQRAFPDADAGSGIKEINHYPECDGLYEALSHDLMVKVLRQARDQSTGGLLKLN